MIAALSKAVILYLSPLLSLTSVILTLLAFLAPTALLHDRVALLTVIPSTALIQQNPEDVDGPSLFMGVLGFCARAFDAQPLNCTNASISPTYDLSALPRDAPTLLLSAPSSATPVAISVAVFFSVLFFVAFTAITFRHRLGGKLAALLDRPVVQQFTAWVGFFSFLIGLTSFLIVRMWFGKAVDDFNRTITTLGSQGPKLLADTGNGFTMVWVAYAFNAIPIIISLSKLNVKSTKL